MNESGNKPLGEVELMELDWTLKRVVFVLRHLQDLLLEVSLTLLSRDSNWMHQTRTTWKIRGEKKKMAWQMT